MEQISLMKPKSGDATDPGLLEYLEDLIGSNKYKEKIDNLEIEYDKVLDVKKEKLERVKISEAELLKLDEAKNIAVDYVKKEKQWYQLLNAQHQVERFKANKEVVKNEEDISQLDNKLKDEKKKLKEKLKENDTFVKDLNQMKEQMGENEKLIKENQKRLQDIFARDVKLQNDRKHQLANEAKCKVFYVNIVVNSFI